MTEIPSPVEDVHLLFAKVRSHPDFAGGTIFTRSDIASALCADDGEPSSEQVAALTDEVREAAEQILADFIFASPYTWRQALRDSLNDTTSVTAKEKS